MVTPRRHTPKPAHEPAPIPDPVRTATSGELGELDAIGVAGLWTIDGRTISLKALDKVLCPATDTTPNVTKGDLIRYYATAGAAIVPFLRDRPVNVQRFPNGIHGPGFWQKELARNAPPWLRRWHNTQARDDDTQRYAVVEDVASLVWLGTQGVLELNGWTSTCDSPNSPTWALIDIDPGGDTTWPEVVLLTRLFRAALDELGVIAAPKTTGKRGVQIWIPVASGYSFAQTRGWVETLSRAVGAVVPDLVSWRWRVSDREGRGRLDYTQNARNKTLVAPYSPRPQAGLPVSMPIDWAALDDPDLTPQKWRIDRLTRGDPGGSDALTALIGLQQELPAIG